MDGDIEGREPLLKNPLVVLLGKVCQGDEVPVEKAVTIVLITYVESLPCSSGHLVNKTEGTVIGASADGRGIDNNSQGEVRIFSEANLERLTRPPIGKRDSGFRLKKFKVDEISQCHPINGKQTVPRTESRLPARTPFDNLPDCQTIAIPP
jgi:hypothetical protein